MTWRESVDGSARLPVSAGTAKWPDMTRRTPASVAARNGTQLDGLQLVPRPVDDVEGVVRVDAPLALAREVLARAGHARGLEAGEPRRGESRDLGGIVAERADAQRRVRRVRRDVEDRRVVDVHADRAELAPDRPPDALRQARVAGRADGHRAGERGPVVATAGSRPERQQLAALLVGRDEDREAVVARPAPVPPPGARR